jgi:hypothetical protein
MDEKYPEQGTEDNDQDHGAERAGPGASADADTPRPAAGPPPTGDDRVDAALVGLNRLGGAPADEHVAVFEEVHGRLRDILGELDDGPDQPDPSSLAKGRP